jgi:hypothetical protein
MLIKTAALTMLIAAAVNLGACGGGSVSAIPSAPSPTVAAPSPATGGWSYGSGYTRTSVALFGVVTEMTAAGPTPIAGVMVYCDQCGEFGHSTQFTDANGTYSFGGDVSTGGGVWLRGDSALYLIVSKDGYQDPPGIVGSGWRELRLSGDTQFDIALVRR